MEKSLVGDLITVYTADSDIITANTIEVEEKNPVEVIFSIINTWKCGELKRDNFDIKILKAIMVRRHLDIVMRDIKINIMKKAWLLMIKNLKYIDILLRKHWMG